MYVHVGVRADAVLRVSRVCTCALLPNNYQLKILATRRIEFSDDAKVCKKGGGGGWEGGLPARGRKVCGSVGEPLFARNYLEF